MKRLRVDSQHDDNGSNDRPETASPRSTTRRLRACFHVQALR